VVLDTNVLVGAAYALGSASRQILEACLEGKLSTILSPALKKEYDHILPRAVRVPNFDALVKRLLELTVWVEPAQTPRTVADDPEDDKLVALALAGGADALITNDHHLLGLDPLGPVRVLRPAAFVRIWLTS
jgi:putative PIN family toxin of toxin-antitoxin system